MPTGVFTCPCLWCTCDPKPPHFRIALSPWLDHNWRMLAKVCSAAVNGIEAYPVEVEVNAGYGDTIIVIVVNKTPKPSSA